MADPQRPTDGAPPTHIHIEKKSSNWIIWLVLALVVLALLFALSRCSQRDALTPAPAATQQPAEVVGTTADASRSSVLAGTSALGGYLAGTDPAPRRFTFEKVNFDTASSQIRPGDREEIATIAGVLKQYPRTRIRIAGYADARGTAPANLQLGDERASSVKAALVAQGIDAGRIETGTGGEADPVDSNATAAGRQENRRTELVVIQR